MGGALWVETLHSVETETAIIAAASLPQHEMTAVGLRRTWRCAVCHAPADVITLDASRLTR